MSTMSTPRIRSSPFASATSMFFSSLIPSGGAVSSAIRGFRTLVPLRKVVTDIFLNMKLRPPPPLPPPLPPPPTRTFELFGPHLVSRTVEYAAPSTSRRCHPPSTPSGDILFPVRSSFVTGIVIFVMGLFGLGFGISLVLRRVSDKPRSKSMNKPGVLSALSARLFPTLGTIMRIAAISCCIYGVIQVQSYPTLGVRLAFNPHVGIMLAGDKSPVLVRLVEDLRQFFGTSKNSIAEVVHQWVRDRGSAYLTAALTTFKDITDDLALAAFGRTSNTVLRNTTVGCGGATFDLVTKTWSFPQAGSSETTRRIRELIHTTVTAVLAKPIDNMTRILMRAEAMASYIYEVLQLVSLPLLPPVLAPAVPYFIRWADILLDAATKAATPFVTCIQYFPIPSIGDFSGALMVLGFVYKFSPATFQVMCEPSTGVLSQYIRSFVTFVATPWKHVEAVALVSTAFSRIISVFKRRVGPVPRLATLSMATDVDFDAILAEYGIFPPSADVVSLVATPLSSPERVVDTTVSPQSSESAEGSYSESSEDVMAFRHVVTDSEKASQKRSKHTPALRIDTQSVINSISEASTGSSSSTSTGPSSSDSTSPFTGELTPATSVPDVGLLIPQPQETKSGVSAPSSPQPQDLDRPALVSGASSSETDPLVGPVDKEDGWTVVKHKKWKRRTYDKREVIMSNERRPPHARPQARLRARSQKPVSPAPSCDPSEASSSLSALNSSKLPLGSSRSNPTRPQGPGSFLPRPAKTPTSCSSSEEIWYTIDGEYATEDTKLKLNAEWFPPYPSRNTPLPPMSAWGLGPDWESKIGLRDSEAVKEHDGGCG
ncbi:hypothetical protein BD410DRAFT_501075 [Rickenella mellea]|uniref:Uncharacterized protein n=1 Tax=Rickenella mellea TaxID=50990 RepID=A0A4Y7PV07_9AGAM|nr:hypothetical protein BD410DRAFT_501075 [Rickenella mellea]